MAGANAVWGIDIGQCALKAIKLRTAEEGKVEAMAFDVIEHSKILSQPDADRDELISSALEKFASRNDWQGDRFVVGVPGQQTFARFCKMPPIDLKKDAKKIPELVRYEASQQIPFDMEDVVWDYQVFTSEGSPDIEVGIFAIRKDLIRKHLGYFGAVGIAPIGVQAIPAALYNFCSYDGQAAPGGGATVIIDVGSQNTDLIIVEPSSAWTRNIPLGGNSFTEALVRAFKLSFAKAESLKRSAAESKYARQIFQAMRPVFADLVAEIQRSIGFYSSTHRDVELRKVLALGNAFLLPGLQKYLENNLTIGGGVHKLEKLERLVPTATINAPQFTENILSFGAAYGLALQGLGLAKIHASLLPPEMARIAVWRKKRPYFAATAAALVLAAAVPWVSNALDRQALGGEQSDTQRVASSAMAEARGFKTKYQQATTDTHEREQDIQNLLKLQDQKDVLPRLVALVHEAMPTINPPELAKADSAEDLRKMIEADPARCKRTERGQLIIESLDIEYKSDLASAELSPTGKPSGGGPAPSTDTDRYAVAGPGSRGPTMGNQDTFQDEAGENAETGFVVHVTGRLLYRTDRSVAVRWLEGEYYDNLRKLSHKPGLGFYIPDDDPKDRSKRSIGETLIKSYYDMAAAGNRPQQPWDPKNPGGTTAEQNRAARFQDPVTGEDAQSDWSVTFAFKVRLGEPPAPEAPPEQ